MRRRGRPGLLGTVARTAVVAGTASATANAVNRRAQAHAVEQQAAVFRADQAAGQAAAAQPALQQAGTEPSSTSDLVSQLAELGRLRDAGVLTDAEFDAAKGRLLG